MKQKKEVDYTRARKIVEQINMLLENSVPLRAHFMHEGFDFWQAYQMELFVQAKRFTVDPEGAIRGLRKSRKLRFFSRFTFWCISYITLQKTKFSGKRPLLIYSVDKFPQGKHACDFRLKELYTAFDTTKASFLELMYTPSAAVLIKNMWTRKRLCIYTSATDFLVLFKRSKKNISDAYADIYETTDADEALFVRELLKTLEDQFIFIPKRVTWLRKVFRECSIPKMYLIDDMWHCFESLCAAQLEQVPTVAIQHGHFTKYHFGVIPYSESKGLFVKPSRLFVWTEYWKRELARLGSFFTEDEIQVAGLKESITLKGAHEVRENQKIGVLIPYETDAPKESMRRCIAHLRTQPDVELYFKPRSDLDTKVQCAQYGVDEGIIVTQNIPYDLVQVVIGTYSTILYDMIGHGISVLLLTDVLDYGEGMIQNGIAYRATTPEHVYAVIQKIREDRALGMHEKQRQVLYEESTQTLTESLTLDITKTIQKYA